MINFEIPFKVLFFSIDSHGKYFKTLFYKKLFPVGHESSLSRFLVKYLNNLDTISSCQNDECFLIILLQWFITQIYTTPNIIFFTSTIGIFVLFLSLLCTVLWTTFIFIFKKVFYLGAISACAWAIIFNEISIVWLKIKLGNGLWFH